MTGTAYPVNVAKVIAKMAKKIYDVTYERDGTMWLARIPSVKGCYTHGRTLAEARVRIRKALSICVDYTVAKAVLRDHIGLPGNVRQKLDARKRELTKSEEVLMRLRELNASAARALVRDTKLSLRDAGELLGASQETVRSWVA